MAFARRFIGFQILLLAVLSMALMSGNFSLFIDVPNLIIMGGLLLGGTLVCFSVRQVIDALTGTLAGAEAAPVSAGLRLQRIAVFARLYQMAWGAGLVVALLTMIAMLGDLSDPASIGVGMAVALTAPAYGAVLAEFVFNPLQQIAMNQPITPDDSDGLEHHPSSTPVPSPSQSGLWRGTTVVAVMIAFLLLPIVSFSEIKKEDAFSPEIEATYLRYLYGEDAPESQAVSSRLNLSRSADADAFHQAVTEEYRRVTELRERVRSESMPGGLTHHEQLMWKLEQLRKSQVRIRRPVLDTNPAFDTE